MGSIINCSKGELSESSLERSSRYSIFDRIEGKKSDYNFA